MLSANINMCEIHNTPHLQLHFIYVQFDFLITKQTKEIIGPTTFLWLLCIFLGVIATPNFNFLSSLFLECCSTLSSSVSFLSTHFSFNEQFPSHWNNPNVLPIPINQAHDPLKSFLRIPFSSSQSLGRFNPSSMQSLKFQVQASHYLLLSPSGDPFLGKASSYQKDFINKAFINKASPCLNTFILVIACFMEISGNH